MIDSDFYEDWIKILQARLIDLDYQIPNDASHEEISILYFNAIRRRIQPAVRSVLRSCELICPEELQTGLDQLEKKIEAGDDLTAHLSRGLKKAGLQDNLLNDWGVYHFHLGTNIEGDGFAERTGPVLFALVTRSKIYAIQVYDHGNWSNREVVEIIHNNWPEIVERFRLKGITDIAYNPTSDDIKSLRDAHTNTVLKMNDGTIYSPIGGGMMTDGSGSDTLLQSDHHARTIVKIERGIKKSPEEILTSLSGLGHDGQSSIKLTLQDDDQGLWAYCHEYNIRFKLLSSNQ